MAGYFPAQPRAWQGTLGFYQQFLHSKASAPFIKNAEMDKIIDRACQALDDHSGQAALMEAAKYVRKHHHAFPVCEFDLAYGVSKKIGNWNPGNLPGDLNLDNLFRN